VDPYDVSAYSDPSYLVGATIAAVILIVAHWKIYTKAGRPGWASIIPFYNVYVLLKIVGRPGWWLVLYFIPVVNFIAWIIVMLDLSKAFGRGVGLAIGLILLPGLFHLVLAFGSAQYVRGTQQAPATA
jgi:hypothetical protein